MALTPVAVLMFRFNNPDALLTLLMALAVWATLRTTAVATALKFLALKLWVFAPGSLRPAAPRRDGAERPSTSTMSSTSS